jgi:hypothetical protein
MKMGAGTRFAVTMAVVVLWGEGRGKTVTGEKELHS